MSNLFQSHHGMFCCVIENRSCHFPGTLGIWWHLHLSCFFERLFWNFSVRCATNGNTWGWVGEWCATVSFGRNGQYVGWMATIITTASLGFFTLWQMHDAAWCKQVAINIKVFKNIIHIAIHKDFLRISSHGSALCKSLQHCVGKILLWVPCFGNVKAFQHPMSKGPNPTPIGQSPAIHLGMDVKILHDSVFVAIGSQVAQIIHRFFQSGLGLNKDLSNGNKHHCYWNG